MQFEDKKIKNGILWILILLSVVAAVNQLLIGFDIDEGYAVSMPFRLLQGDHLFADMWEVHQTSALLPAAFLWLPDRPLIWCFICALLRHCYILA